MASRNVTRALATITFSDESVSIFKERKPKQTGLENLSNCLTRTRVATAGQVMTMR